METQKAKVLRARLMDSPEVFRKLGINPDKVETWEDGPARPVKDPRFFGGHIILRGSLFVSLHLCGDEFFR